MKIKSILVSQPKPADISKTPFADMMKKYGVNFKNISNFRNIQPSSLPAAMPSTISLGWPRKCAMPFLKR